MDSRKTAIIELLKDSKQVYIQDLVKRFGVCRMTIVRDLEELENQGFLTRVRGGATPTSKLKFLLSALPDFGASECKADIGKLAASLVKPGYTVMIDTGTTALEVARYLPRDQSITVVTTSLSVVQELYKSEIKIIILGGSLRDEFPSVYGPLTELLLNHIHVDLLFMGCDGANSTDGFYSNDFHISSLEKRMINIADKVIVVTESVKFQRRALARYAMTNDVDVLITDNHLSETDKKNLETQGVAVMTVNCQV